MVSVCLPSDALSQHLLSYLGFSYLGRGVAPLGHASARSIAAVQYACLENLMNSIKRQNDRILKGELPGSVDVQYATGDQWRNNSGKNEEMEPK